MNLGAHVGTWGWSHILHFHKTHNCQPQQMSNQNLESPKPPTRKRPMDTQLWFRLKCQPISDVSFYFVAFTTYSVVFTFIKWEQNTLLICTQRPFFLVCKLSIIKASYFFQFVLWSSYWLIMASAKEKSNSGKRNRGIGKLGQVITWEKVLLRSFRIKMSIEQIMRLLRTGWIE